jgi:hypothetical protein
MVPTQVQRTLVKSPPELWAELSDPAALARHLGELGEIRITRLEPERKVEWTAARASGTVRIDPSGWGTRVTLTASQVLGGSPPPARTAEPGEPAAREPAARVPATSTQPPPTPQREAAASGSEVRASSQAPAAASSPDPLPAPAAAKPPPWQDVPADDLPAEDPPAEDPPARPDPQPGTSGGFFARLLGRLRGPEPVYELPPPPARPREAEANLTTSHTLAPREQPASAARPPDAPPDAPAPGERSLSGPEPPPAPTPPPAASPTPGPQGSACDDAPATAPPRSHTLGPHEARRGPATTAPVSPPPSAAIPETEAESREPEPAVADVLRSALDSLGAAHHRPFSRA